MLKEIHIKGYKCLKEARLETSLLNIFAGPNSSGKSSTIQSLLLLRQSQTEQKRIPSLNLSGELYEGGTAADVLHPESGYHIDFSFSLDKTNVSYNFKWIRDLENNRHARSLRALEHSTQELIPQLANSEFIYLNAERSRPKVFFDLPSDRVGLAGLLGKHGEFTAARLAQASYGSMVPGWTNSDTLRERLQAAPCALDGIDIEDDLVRSEGRIDQVVKQMLCWVMPGAHFDASENPATDTALLDFLRDRTQTSAKVRPTHMGFGLTYALPVISAGFFLPPCSTIIIENPEAHLHPYSQSRLGVLLAMIAASGRQVFIETHSDHFVNGIRLAVAKGLISSTDVKTHFFKPPKDGTTADIVSIYCEADGGMSKWPPGFFDQIESDLSML